VRPPLQAVQSHLLAFCGSYPAGILRREPERRKNLCEQDGNVGRDELRFIDIGARPSFAVMFDQVTQLEQENGPPRGQLKEHPRCGAKAVFLPVLDRPAMVSCKISQPPCHRHDRRIDAREAIAENLFGACHVERPAIGPAP
jgi:hypothetical protein